MSIEAFARYAYPPNELGYCGPPDAQALLRAHPDAVGHAEAFTGAWPYLELIAAATGLPPLHPEVSRTYWVGGPLLGAVDGAALLGHLRTAMAGQPTGLLDALDDEVDLLAHHSFHVMVVYPWIRLLRSGPATPLGILQACRIRWGTVDEVDDDTVVIDSAPLEFDGERLLLGAVRPETVRWRRGQTSLTPQPRRGQVVSAHWNWICDTLDQPQHDELAAATKTTLGLVNRLLASGAARPAGEADQRTIAGCGTRGDPNNSRCEAGRRPPSSVMP